MRGQSAPCRSLLPVEFVPLWAFRLAAGPSIREFHSPSELVHARFSVMHALHLSVMLQSIDLARLIVAWVSRLRMT